MKIRFYIDPETEEAHIHKHAVFEDEVAEVFLSGKGQDRVSREGSRILMGQTDAGRFLRIVYSPDPEPACFRDYCLRAQRQTTGRFQAPSAQETAMKKNIVNQFPPGWDEARVRRVIDYYDGQSEEDALAEDEAVFSGQHHTLMEVPADLVPAIRELIARHEQHEGSKAP